MPWYSVPLTLWPFLTFHRNFLILFYKHTCTLPSLWILAIYFFLPVIFLLFLIILCILFVLCVSCYVQNFFILPTAVGEQYNTMIRVTAMVWTFSCYTIFCTLLSYSQYVFICKWGLIITVLWVALRRLCERRSVKHLLTCLARIINHGFMFFLIWT